MIAAWMLFALEINALLFAAAWIAERALLAARRPLRGVWVAAIVGANVLPLVISQLPLTSTLTERWALSVAPQSLLARVSSPLLGVWAIAFAIGLFVCASAIWRMSRTRRSWKSEHVDQTPVLVSHDIGPALVGVMHYSIVVPQWAYSLEQGARRLLLTHEREHARHYDPLLLAAAVLTVVAAPWNVFNWLFLKRLHLAVEMDCDQRVLRAHPDARGYGALLLDVAEQVLPSVMPAAAFVEHGASLETRLNAISETRKPSQWLRVGGGIGASLVLVAAACVMPRPVVIVVNPRVQSAPTAAAATTTAAAVPEPAANIPPASSVSSVSIPSIRGVRADASILPVAPSAQTVALDVEEADRMRTAVLASAPRTLESWPRADSALVLLFNARGEVVKQTSIPVTSLRTESDTRFVFTQLFTIPEIGGLDFSSETRIARGAHFETLDVPLRLFAGRMKQGVAIPLTRTDVVPSHAAMVATLRGKYPDLLKDNTPNPVVGGMLFGSRGELLATAAVRMESSATNADGSSNPAYDSTFLKKAFGSVMDSGAVVQSGRAAYFDETTPRDGLPRLIYAVIVKRSQFDVLPKAPKNMNGVVAYSASASRVTGTLPEQQAMNKRLLGLVQTRVPDAFGAWSRADSVVLFLFDEYDQLVARRAAPIPESGQLPRLADLFSQRVVGLQAADVETVGTSFFTASPSGRELTPGLYVIWARLKRATAPGMNR